LPYAGREREGRCAAVQCGEFVSSVTITPREMRERGQHISTRIANPGKIAAPPTPANQNVRGGSTPDENCGGADPRAAPGLRSEADQIAG